MADQQVLYNIKTMGLRHGQLLFAEVKPVSPFGWKSDRSWDDLFEIAEEYGDWISVHTNKLWGGSFKLLAEACRRTDKPVLAKGYHTNDEDIERALDAGAHRVLTVRETMPEQHAELCVVEPLTLMGLGKLAGAAWTAWNSRNPYTGDTKIDDFDRARQVRPEGLMCQASNLRTVDDVHPTASAVLVGAHLPEFVRSLDRSTEPG